MNLKELIAKILKENEDIKGKKITTTQTSVDPVTRSITWDVEYEPDFSQLLRVLIDAEKLAYNLLAEKKLGRDKFFKEIASNIRYIKNEYRNHLRDKYPGEYEQAKKQMRKK
jgi:hypothetical protein